MGPATPSGFPVRRRVSPPCQEVVPRHYATSLLGQARARPQRAPHRLVAKGVLRVPRRLRLGARLAGLKPLCPPSHAPDVLGGPLERDKGDRRWLNMNPPLSPRLVALALPLDDFFMGFGAILAYDAGYHPESLDPGVVLAVALTVYERYQRREAATWLGLSLGGAAAVSSAHAGATKACGYLYGLRLARPEPSLAPAELSAGDCARAFRARLRRHRRAMRLGAGAYAGVWSLECALRGNDSGLCLE